MPCPVTARANPEWCVRAGSVVENAFEKKASSELEKKKKKKKGRARRLATPMGHGREPGLSAIRGRNGNLAEGARLATTHYIESRFFKY